MRARQRHLGLALSGGGLLGVAHIGVLEVLEENGIFPGVVAGTSAGAFVAALYAAGLEPRALRELALRLSRDDLYAWNFTLSGFLKMLLGNLRDILDALDATPLGLLDGSRIAAYVERVAGVKRLKGLSLPVGLVAADLISGKKVVFTNAEHVPQAGGAAFIGDAPLGLAVRASTALPGVFEPVPYQGMLLADGGLVENIPAATCRLLGATRVVAVRHAAEGLRKRPGSLVQVIMRGIEVMGERGMQDDLRWADAAVVTPAVAAGLSDFERVPELLEMGRAAAVNALPNLKELARGNIFS
ncbi:MAG: patatin-like phospholipase family protein [Thermacetogeniaceae bacterium]